jgi:hypothetical protein
VWTNSIKYDTRHELFKLHMIPLVHDFSSLMSRLLIMISCLYESYKKIISIQSQYYRTLHLKQSYQYKDLFQTTFRKVRCRSIIIFLSIDDHVSAAYSNSFDASDWRSKCLDSKRCEYLLKRQMFSLERKAIKWLHRCCHS